MADEFAGKTFIITGAGRVRGQGVQEAAFLAERGAQVVIGDIVGDEGQAAAERIGAACRYVHLDVTSEADWTAAIDAATELGGAVNGLVNNAAVYKPQSLENTSAADFDLHMQVNQLGTFLGMKLIAPALRAAGGGSIVNVSSSAGLKGSARAIAYCATKWALRGMTKAVAQDLGKDAIRVNSIHPGPIDTPMLDGFTPEQRKQRTEMVPLRREGSVLEVAELVGFLLSDRSAFITGAEIAIDGGITL